MYRLNAQITEETAQILKEQAKKYGCSMGTIITMWALKEQKEIEVLKMSAMYSSLQDGTVLK